MISFSSRLGPTKDNETGQAIDEVPVNIHVERSPRGWLSSTRRWGLLPNPRGIKHLPRYYLFINKNQLQGITGKDSRPMVLGRRREGGAILEPARTDGV